MTWSSGTDMSWRCFVHFCDCCILVDIPLVALFRNRVFLRYSLHDLDWGGRFSRFLNFGCAQLGFLGSLPRTIDEFQKFRGIEETFQIFLPLVLHCPTLNPIHRAVLEHTATVMVIATLPQFEFYSPLSALACGLA
ncbi:hypothetical protein V6N11_080473 [Hibiscus sabdariffa]|uniref:Uncharacterized protein n=1 Tax=Hibiscus sabdariffa TaxID=183260 RepID=A0ABR2R7R0_9ROSI